MVCFFPAAAIVKVTKVSYHKLPCTTGAKFHGENKAAFTLVRCGRPATIRPGTTGTGRTRVQCLHVYAPENKLQPVITAQRYVHAHVLATCAL